MMLHFRTKRDVNGNCMYLGIDTEKQEFSRQSRGWIDREYPELKQKDYRWMIGQLQRFGWQEIDCI